MAVEQVWDTTTTNSTSEELAYFSGLKFAVPTATSQIHALPLQHMLDWLLNPNGPPLVEGMSTMFKDMCPTGHLYS